MQFSDTTLLFDAIVQDNLCYSKNTVIATCYIYLALQQRDWYSGNGL